MECKEADEQLVSYILGALDDAEMAAMDRHVDSCSECSLKLRLEGDIVTQLTYAVPQLETPPRVKRQLFSRIDAAESGEKSRWTIAGWLRLLPDLGQGVAAHSGVAVASMLVVVMVLGGVWFNSRLNTVASEKEALAAQMESAAAQTQGDSGSESELVERLTAQRYLTNMAAIPGTSVSVLSGTQQSGNARGMIVVPETGRAALLAALELPPLPSDRVYQVWLVKDGQKHSAGLFTVDSTGYGQTIINLFAPLGYFDGILITIERAGGSADPTGESVLKSDL